MLLPVSQVKLMVLVPPRATKPELLVRNVEPLRLTLAAVSSAALASSMITPLAVNAPPANTPTPTHELAPVKERHSFDDQIDEIERRIPSAGGGNQPASVPEVERYRPANPMMELARF